MLMQVVSKLSRHTLERNLAEQDAEISILQYGMIRVLAHEGNLTLSELSRKFHLDPSTLVPSVDHLERKGLVTRQRDPNDRRRLPISVTEQALELTRTIEVIKANDPLMSSLRQMDGDSVHALLTLMRDLVHHLPEGEIALEGVQSRLSSFAPVTDRKHKDDRVCKPHNEDNT